MIRRLAPAAVLAFLLAVAGLATLTAGAASADPAAPAAEVVLRDGSTVAVARPYVTKGATAILTRPDGTLVSLPLSEIDVEKTAASMAAAKARAAAPAATPAPTPEARAMTPAEAAKTRGARKASVVITDADVAPGALSPGGEDGGGSAVGDVSIGAVSATRTKTGYFISGTVQNSGKGPVQGVSVSVQLIGEENKTLKTGFARVAKGTLDPGESSAFEAEVESKVEAKNFRYVPRWQVRETPASARADARSKETAAAEQAADGGGDRPPKKAEKPPEPTPPPPPPGWAAPQASAPIESSTSAPQNQPYVPRPSASQPQPPKAH